MTYLKSGEELQLDLVRSELKMHELYQQDPVGYVARYPIIKELYKKRPGRPVEHRLDAVQALQLQIEKNWTLGKVTAKICRCGKPKHDSYCEQNLRQSIISLKRLLRKF